MTIAESLLPEYDQEMAATRRTLERIPSDRLEWKPHEKSFSMLQLGGHMANLVSWLGTTVNHDEFDMAPPEGEPWAPPELTTLAAVLEHFDANVAENRSVLEQASDARLMGSWKLLSGGQEVLTMPRIAVLRSFIFNHMVHHRGQLTVYLRLNDVPVPSLYGPSADEQPGQP